jgi:penicillin-binding protein 2
LSNKAIAGLYAPGSTFKMVVALAGLEKGVINPATPVFCGGSVRLGDSRFHCWKRGGHGRMTLREGIVQSCDVYFYEVARRVGVDAIAEMAGRLGLGGTLGLDLPNEQAGLIPTRAWKRAKLGQPWHQGETLITGIGQGYVLSTPLQLAVMTARLANGGYSVTPRLVRKVQDRRQDQPMIAGHQKVGNSGRRRICSRISVSPAHLRAVLDAMIGVVNAGNGTARGVGHPRGGLRDGGQDRNLAGAPDHGGGAGAGGGRTRTCRGSGGTTHCSSAIAPVHAPRYAVAVIVEHGGGGSKVAAPIARDILLAAQKLDSLRIAAPRPAPPPPVALATTGRLEAGGAMPGFDRHHLSAPRKALADPLAVRGAAVRDRRHRRSPCCTRRRTAVIRLGRSGHSSASPSASR